MTSGEQVTGERIAIQRMIAAGAAASFSYYDWSASDRY